MNAITDPKAFAAVRFLLSDHREALPLRNEAANLLRRSGDAQLDDELTAILADEHELEDIRSYAAQHLGVSYSASRCIAVIAALVMMCLMPSAFAATVITNGVTIVQGPAPDGTSPISPD